MGTLRGSCKMATPLPETICKNFNILVHVYVHLVNEYHAFFGVFRYNHGISLEDTRLGTMFSFPPAKTMPFSIRSYIYILYIHCSLLTRWPVRGGRKLEEDGGWSIFFFQRSRARPLESIVLSIVPILTSFSLGWDKSLPFCRFPSFV